MPPFRVSWWSVLTSLSVCVACASRAQSVADSRASGDQPSAVPSAGAEENTDAAVDWTQPVPVAPVPSDAIFGKPIRLAPTPDCVHPEVEVRCEGDYCEIPPGCFIMGEPLDEPRTAYAKQVQVTLTHPFELGRFEVTNAVWQAEGLALPTRDQEPGRCNDPDCPVSNVNLFDVITFLNLYSEARGLKPCYELRDCSGTFASGRICNRVTDEGNLDCDKPEEDGLTCEGAYFTADTPYACEGYRLPTEAEWEYGARAGTRSAYWSGEAGWTSPLEDNCTEQPNLLPVGWYCRNSAGVAHPVGQKLANPWGLFDVHGNVSEWTSTNASDEYGQGPLIEPVGYWYDLLGRQERSLMPDQYPGVESSRLDAFVQRGGAFSAGPYYCKSAAPYGYVYAYGGSSSAGFRIARTLR